MRKRHGFQSVDSIIFGPFLNERPRTVITNRRELQHLGSRVILSRVMCLPHLDHRRGPWSVLARVQRDRARRLRRVRRVLHAVPDHAGELRRVLQHEAALRVRGQGEIARCARAGNGYCGRVMVYAQQLYVWLHG